MRRIGSVLVMTAAVALAGCGGDDGSTSEGTTTTGVAATTTTTDAGAQGTGDEGFTGADSDEFCSWARQVNEAEDSIDAGFGPDSGPDDMRSAFEEMTVLFDQVDDRAPDEIQDDFRMLADGIVQLGELLDEYDYDFMALMTDPDAQTKLEAFDSPDLESAGQRIDTYMQEVCGIDSEE